MTKTSLWRGWAARLALALVALLALGQIAAAQDATPSAGSPTAAQMEGDALVRSLDPTTPPDGWTIPAKVGHVTNYLVHEWYQNLTKGEGFLILEGNPWDGSRSIYHNAAVLGYERGKAKIELIGIFDPRTDRVLPRLNDKARQLVEWNESALGAYYTDNRWKKTSVEAYYFYKREFGDPRPASNLQFQADRYVYTAGGRTVRKLPNSFSLTGEFAWQWGHQRPNREIRAWGGYGYLKRTFGAKQRHSASFGYWGMSGSDPAKPGTIGNWDPLFSRWPKWSEGYIYTQFKENGVAYWTNTGMWQGEGVYVPWKPLSLRGTFYEMRAYHPYPGSKALYSTGTGRGEEYQLRADLTVNKNWRGHVLYEGHVPGSFYAGKDPGYFFRLEVSYLFTGQVPF